jgi:2'-hydroxyisoflavone reductase
LSAVHGLSAVTWLPESETSLKGFMFVSIDKARKAGLTFRSVSETVADTLSWHQAHQANEKLKAGPDAEKEQRLLREWQSTLTRV